MTHARFNVHALIKRNTLARNTSGCHILEVGSSYHGNDYSCFVPRTVFIHGQLTSHKTCLYKCIPGVSNSRPAD